MGEVVVGQKQKSQEGEKRRRGEEYQGAIGVKGRREDGGRGEWGRRGEERPYQPTPNHHPAPQPSTHTSGSQAISDPSVKTRT